MTKISYTATFSNGRVLTRKSERAYTHAYCWTGISSEGNEQGNSGFAATRQLAEKAIARETGYLRVPPAKRSGPLAYVRHMAKLRANWKPGKVTFQEVVAVTLTIRVAKAQREHLPVRS